MSLEETTMGNPMVMPVAPMYGGNCNNGGMFGGDNWAWIILLLLLGWGNNGWGNNAGNGGGAGNMLYPWMNQSQQVNDGFRDQMINGNITGIRDSVAGISNQLCNGFAGVTAAITGAQMADLERSFAAQTANTAGMTALQSQLAQCCCDNRAATADLKYTVATENCADRTAAMQNTRDIIDSQNRGTQAILDKLCALELDGVKGQLAQAQRDNVDLQNQLNMAALRESATAQNAFISQGFANEVDQLYNRLNSCPVSTVPVYGKQPIFQCGNNGCGCGNM